MRFCSARSRQTVVLGLTHFDRGAGVTVSPGTPVHLVDGEIFFQRPGHARHLPQYFPRRGVPLVNAYGFALLVFAEFRNATRPVKVQIGIEVLS
jgi:hypothetical protein